MDIARSAIDKVHVVKQVLTLSYTVWLNPGLAPQGDTFLVGGCQPRRLDRTGKFSNTRHRRREKERK